MLDHKYICDVKGCAAAQCNGLPAPSLPPHWAQLVLDVTVPEPAPTHAQHHRIVRARIHLCPDHVAKLADSFVDDSSWFDLLSGTPAADPTRTRA